MPLLIRMGTLLASMLLLLLPALWNGFPLLQYDTGGYIARWYEGTLEISRSTVYGLYVTALTHPDFWPVVLVNAAATVWILALVLRAHRLDKPHVLLVTVAALTVFTTLPWLVDVILTDIFAGLSVLALYLLVIRPDTLRRFERPALVLFIAFAAATHGATLAVLLMLLVAGALVAVVDRRRVRIAGVAAGFAALVLSAMMVFGANYMIAGRIAWTPGGTPLLFGSMLQSGIVARYLDDHCPDPRLRLCAHRSELPATADEFFWRDGVFQKLGRFEGLSDEMNTIVTESLVQYPWLQIKAATVSTVEQIAKVRTGYGVHTEIWHTLAIIKELLPGIAPAMQGAHQQKGELDFTIINAVHEPVAWASMALLVALLVAGFVYPSFSELSWLAAVVVATILGNAFVCGALSNPNDRYGARMVWLATFVLVLVPWHLGMRSRSRTDESARSGNGP
jgi:hypothetical protein